VLTLRGPGVTCAQSEGTKRPLRLGSPRRLLRQTYSRVTSPAPEIS
jgi:hypothetical protein